MRSNIQVLGGKTGYNDDARYCLVIATKIDGHTYFMSFLANEGKLTRFGDVARVADWIVAHKPQEPTGHRRAAWRRAPTATAPSAPVAAPLPPVAPQPARPAAVAPAPEPPSAPAPPPRRRAEPTAPPARGAARRRRRAPARPPATAP